MRSSAVATPAIFGEDLSDLFVALGEAAAEHETGVVFLLDEVQFLAPERSLRR